MQFHFDPVMAASPPPQNEGYHDADWPGCPSPATTPPEPRPSSWRAITISKTLNPGNKCPKPGGGGGT